MNVQKISDEKIFDITKVIYTDMKANFDSNFIGSKEALRQFKRDYIQPLYPAKRNLNQDETESEQTSISNDQSVDALNNQNSNINIQPHSSQQGNIDSPEDVEYDSGIQKYSFKQLCCYLGIGNFLCWKSNPPDPVYEDLGLGICLYLKFMKHLVYTLVIMSILPIMQIVFFYSIAQSNQFEPSTNYQKTLFAMSIGTLSLEGMKCVHQVLNQSTQYSFDLYCPVGSVNILGPVYSNSTIAGLRACKQDINLFLNQGKYFIQSNQFTSQTNCDSILSNCTYDIQLLSESTQFLDLSVTFQCINGKSKLGGIFISRSTALICSIIFDLVFIVGMVIFFWSQTLAESKEKAWFKSKQLLLNEFSVQIGYFSKNNFMQEFKEFMINLKKRMQFQGGLDRDLFKNIVQIRIPDGQEFLQNQQKRKNSYKALYNLMGQIFIDRKRDPWKYIDCEDFIMNAFRTRNDFEKYKEDLVKELNEYMKRQKQTGTNKEKMLKALIIFSKPKYKRLLLESTTVIARNKYLQLNQNQQNEQKKYIVSEPPAPAVILWDNKNKTYKVLRNFISWTVTIIIIGATYVLIAFMLWQQNKLLKNYSFSIECNILYPNNDFSSFDESLNNLNTKSYTHCYCLSKSIVLAINNDPHCSEWAFEYTLYVFIPIIFSIGIVIINAIISAIYKALSKFEAHSYLTSEMYSYIVKKTLLLILNLALIIIILSIDTKASNEPNAFSFLFQGIYSDITADWYLQVGLIIVLTMIFNMLSPFADSFVYIILQIIKKIGMMFFNKRKAHKKTKSAYISFYRDQSFPIDERYALVLAVLTITLCLNFVFPLMTLILLLTLFLLELNDKVLIIKAYQKPINFGKQLHDKFMKSLLFVLILHLVVTSLLITEPFLLVAGETSLEGSIAEVNRNRFEAFFQTGYAIPYAILLAMILLSIFVIFSSKMYLKTKPNQRVYLGLDGIPYEQHKFYHLLNKYELRRTLALKKREVQRLQILQTKYMKSSNTNDVINENDNSCRIIDSSSNILRQDTKQSSSSLEFNGSKSFLRGIAQFNLQKLENRQKQNIPDKERIVKLTGMTIYDWSKDWVFFNQHPKASFQIPDLNFILQKLTSPEIQNNQQKLFDAQNMN